MNNWFGSTMFLVGLLCGFVLFKAVDTASMNDIAKSGFIRINSVAYKLSPMVP
jgi:hypothetical protein